MSVAYDQHIGYDARLGYDGGIVRDLVYTLSQPQAKWHGLPPSEKWSADPYRLQTKWSFGPPSE